MKEKKRLKKGRGSLSLDNSFPTVDSIPKGGEAKLEEGESTSAQKSSIPSLTRNSGVESAGEKKIPPSPLLTAPPSTGGISFPVKRTPLAKVKRRLKFSAKAFAKLLPSLSPSFSTRSSKVAYALDDASSPSVTSAEPSDAPETKANDPSSRMFLSLFEDLSIHSPFKRQSSPSFFLLHRRPAAGTTSTQLPRSTVSATGSHVFQSPQPTAFQTQNVVSEQMMMKELHSENDDVISIDEGEEDDTMKGIASNNQAIDLPEDDSASSSSPNTVILLKSEGTNSVPSLKSCLKSSDSLSAPSKAVRFNDTIAMYEPSDYQTLLIALSAAKNDAERRARLLNLGSRKGLLRRVRKRFRSMMTK